MGLPDAPVRQTGLGQKLGTIGGGIAGTIGSLFPTPISNNSQAVSNAGQQTTASQNNYSASDINSLLQTLSDLTTRNSSTATSTPTLAGAGSQDFLNNLIRRYSGLANQSTNLTPYQAQQTQGINRNSQLQSQAVNNIMAARGLSTSPVAGTAEANIQANRVGQINNLAQSIPLLQHQLALENLNAAGGFMSQIPRGVSTQTAGESTQQGNTTQQGKTTSVNTSDTNSQTNSAEQGTTISKALQEQGGGIGSILASIGKLLPQILPLLIP